MDTERLTREFIARTLPKEEFTHHAHLRVGLWHVDRYPDDVALDLLRGRIRAFNESVGGVNTASAGYHETITRFYLVMIRRWAASSSSQAALGEREAELIAHLGDRELPLRYYTRERLSSAAARQGWVAPDLQPWPDG